MIDLATVNTTRYRVLADPALAAVGGVDEFAYLAPAVSSASHRAGARRLDRHNFKDRGTMEEKSVEELIEASSLGTPEARALRAEGRRLMMRPVLRAAEELMGDPARYVGSSGSYADGYIDALIDVLTKLRLAEPGVAYERMRQSIDGVVAALDRVDRARVEVSVNWSRSADEEYLDALRALADVVRKGRETEEGDVGR